MKCKVIQNCRIDGKGAAKGDIVEVGEKTFFLLSGIGRVVSYVEPAKQLFTSKKKGKK